MGGVVEMIEKFRSRDNAQRSGLVKRFEEVKSELRPAPCATILEATTDHISINEFSDDGEFPSAT